MLIETLLFRFAWILFIAAILANAAIWWRRAQPHIRADPSVRVEYLKLIRGFIIWTSLPWFLMGLGIVAGWVPTIWHYFNPRSSPFVIAWHAALIAFWIGSAYWILFRNGAQALLDHPGLLNLPVQRAWFMKVMYVLAVIGGLIALIYMYVADFT